MTRTQPESATRPGLRLVLITLSITEITSWGVLYYAFPVLAPRVADDTGWSIAQVTAGFSLSQVVAAVLGVPVGRLLDRRGPRLVMTAGSIVAVPAVVGIATAGSLPEWFAAWTLAGAAMSAVLYQPAFAALTRWYGPRRVTALTTLTLVAGLASTVFAPITAALVGPLDWRGTYLVLAIPLAVVTVPLHAFGLRLPWPAHPADRAGTAPAPDTVRSRAFLALVAAFTLAAFAGSAVVVNLVALLLDRGLSTTTAAWALGLGGAGQVLGRLFYAPLARGTTVRTRTVLVLLAGGAATAVLGLLPGPAAALVAVSVLVGSARGIFTLLQATAVTDRWGAHHYGTLSGVLAAPLTFTTAVAPFLGAALAVALGSHAAMLAVMAAVGLGAAAISLGSVPPREPARTLGR